LSVVTRESAIMGRMSRPGRLRLATACAGLATVVLVTACTPSDESQPPRQDDAANAALSVSTIDPADLDDDVRARMESEVSDLLAGYIVGAFLGEYPRTDFAAGFADFTGGLADNALGEDIEALTVAGVEGVTAVRATRLDARVAFALDSRKVIGASAWVDFEFDVQAGHEPTTRARLHGRFSLARVDGEWTVFGYDLRRSGDGEPVPAEVTS
jgi:hypothetical protein